MTISDEAVEAAARSIYATFRGPYYDLPVAWSDQPLEERTIWEATAGRVLRAAAPHLMAAAWDEGAEAYPLCDAAVSCGACPVCMDPYLVNPYRAGAGE